MNLGTLVSGTRLAVGIELTWLGPDNWQAHACQLQRTGGVVTVKQFVAHFTDFATLAGQLGPEPGPVALVLSGRGLVLRTLPGAVTDSVVDSTQLAALLPGANLTDFYYQLSDSSAQTLVALTRLAPVQELLLACVAVKLWVLDVHLGPLGLPALLPYLSVEERQMPLAAGAYLVTLTTDGENLATATVLATEESLARDYMLGGESIPSEQLLAYTAALGLLTDEISSKARPTYLSELGRNRREWQQRRWFNRLRLVLPLSMLLLLLVNLLASQYLQARQAELAQVAGGDRQLLGRLRVAQRTVQQQQAFLKATGWTNPSSNSLCADRLAATLPIGIQLLAINLNPTQTQSGESSHSLSFQVNVVTVKGQCADAQQFNAWLQRLTQQKWTRVVRDQHFAYDYAGGLGTFTFTLLVNPTALYL